MFGKREKGGKKHARNNLSSPQETNLFERAAGLKKKIGGMPQNNATRVNCPDFEGRRGDPREAKFVLALVFIRVLRKH